MQCTDEELSLLAQLSKEAKEALHAVLGRLELMSDEPLTVWQRRQLAACHFSTDRLLRVAEGIDWLVSGVIGPGPDRWFEPRLLIRRLADMLLRPKEAGNGGRLELRVEPDVPQRLLGDAERIEDCLARLIQDSGPLQAGECREIALSMMPNGKGARSLCFQIVFTASAASERPDMLACLNRTIAERCASMLEGQIERLRANGKGSTIRIILPLKPQPVQDSAQPSPAIGIRILVAEDDDDSYALCEEYLREEPWRVTHVRDGNAAVARATAEEFDLILMDIQMPGLDGFEAARAIREFETRKGRRRVPILVLSAERLDEQQRRGALVGCSGYLRKPVSKNELLTAINQYSISQFCSQ